MADSVTVSSADRIIEIANGFRGARVLMSAIELGVFSVLADRSMTLEATANRLGLHPRGAHDFLDALVALGLLERTETGLYSNTPAAGAYLDRQSPTYIGSWFDHFGCTEYPQWQHLTRALTTGDGQFAATSSDLYASLYADDGTVENFARAMSGATVLVGRQLATAFPWERFGSFIDIGVAEGCLPVQIAQRHRHLKGGGFDLPALQPHFERYVRGHGLGDRLQFHPGDFLSDPLPSADVLVLGRVLHNWDLDTKRRLLAKAYDAIAPGGALIVYERFIDDDRRSSAAGLLASLNMLVMTTGGGELSSAECKALLEESGFGEVRAQPLGSSQHMVFGTKAA